MSTMMVLLTDYGAAGLPFSLLGNGLILERYIVRVVNVTYNVWSILLLLLTVAGLQVSL